MPGWLFQNTIFRWNGTFLRFTGPCQKLAPTFSPLRLVLFLIILVLAKGSLCQQRNEVKAVYIVSSGTIRPSAIIKRFTRSTLRRVVTLLHPLSETILIRFLPQCWAFRSYDWCGFLQFESSVREILVPQYRKRDSVRRKRRPDFSCWFIYCHHPQWRPIVCHCGSSSSRSSFKTVKVVMQAISQGF